MKKLYYVAQLVESEHWLVEFIFGYMFALHFRLSFALRPTCESYFREFGFALGLGPFLMNITWNGKEIQ